MRGLSVCLGMLVLAGGCTPEFENSTTIKDLRLIAIVAEPPEILIDLESVAENPALLADLPPVLLTPLVIDPRGGGREVTYQVQACGNRPDVMPRGSENGPGRVVDSIAQAPCPEGATPVAEGAVVPLSDGTAPISVTFRPTPELLIQAASDDPISVQLGLPITLSFTLRAGDEQVVAIKRVLFTPRLDAEQRPNRNPQISHLTVRPAGEEAFFKLDPAAPPTVALGGRLRLAPAPGEAEPYRARAFSRTERRFVVEEVPEETLRYSFYATKGIFSPGGISTLPSYLVNDPVVEIESTYEAPVGLAADEGPEVNVFVVVKDERGGSSFIRSRLTLQPPVPDR